MAASSKLTQTQISLIHSLTVIKTVVYSNHEIRLSNRKELTVDVNNLDESQGYFELWGSQFQQYILHDFHLRKSLQNDKVMGEQISADRDQEVREQERRVRVDSCDDGTDLYLDGGGHKPQS